MTTQDDAITTPIEQPPAKPKSRRGFASMDPERHRQIAAMGGKTAHALGKAHEFTAEEARNAGRKGGNTTAQDKEHMARIGSLGGAARKRG